MHLRFKEWLQDVPSGTWSGADFMGSSDAVINGPEYWEKGIASKYRGPGRRLGRGEDKRLKRISDMFGRRKR